MPTINNRAVRSLLCVAVIATVLAVLAPGASAQITKQWSQTYNPNSSYDTYVTLGNSAAFDASGNVYGMGYSYNAISSSSRYDYTVRKYAADGTPQWARSFDSGYSSRYDYARAVAVDTNGYVYVTGYGYGPNSNYDCETVCWDQNGNFQWADFYNGSDNAYDYCRHIVADANGNVYVHGYADEGNYDYVTIKYNSSGRQWVRTYDHGNDYEYVYDGELVKVDGAGNVYAGGHTYVSGNYYDFLVVSYTPSGTLRFASTYNGPYDYYDYCYGMDVDPSGNSYLTGYGYTSSSSSYDYIVASFDTNGNFRWANNYHNYSYDYGRSVAYGAGRVYVTGYSYGSGTYYDVATVAFDAATGAQQWANRFGSSGTVYDYGYSVAADDYGAYVAGYTYPNGYSPPYADAFLRTYTPTGSVLGTNFENGSQNYYDYGYDVTADGNGCVALGYRTTENVITTYEYRMATALYCQELGCSVLTARAGGPYNVECNGQPTALGVDASLSCDPNDSPLTFQWTTDCRGGAFDDATAASPNFILTGPPPCPVNCTVSVTVTNRAGETDTDSATVTVEDTTDPYQPNLPADNQVWECDNIPPVVRPDAADLCDPDPAEWVVRNNGTGRCPGIYPVTEVYTAEDACFLRDTVTLHHNVVDTTPPDVTSDASTYCLWSPNHSYYCFDPSDLPFSATDNCSYPLDSEFTSCSCDQPEDGTGDGNTIDDCKIVNDGQAICVRSERAGEIAFGRACDISVTVWDSCGNESTETPVGTIYIPHDSEDGETKGCLNPKDSPTP